MNAEIIQFIPRPKRDDAQTDFPTIAFRSAVRNPRTAPVDAASYERAGPAVGKPSMAKSLVEIALWQGATPEPQSAFSSASCDARMDTCRARLGRERHSRSRLGQGHAAAGEQRQRCAQTHPPDRACNCSS